MTRIRVPFNFNGLFLVFSLFFVVNAFSASIDDLEIIPMVTLEQIGGHSANVAVDPTNNRPHVIWVKDGDMKHVYRKSDGSWSSAEIIDDDTRIVFGGDEHSYPLRNVGMTFDEAGKMHIVYCTQNGMIWYKTWYNGSWSGSVQVVNTTPSKINLDIVLFNNKIYVIYEEGVNDLLFYVVRTGSTWGAPQPLGSGEFPYLFTSDSGYIYVLARMKGDPRSAIFKYMSTSDSDWTTVTGIDGAVGHLGTNPYMTILNGTIYVSWCDKTLAEYDGTFYETAMYCSSAEEPGNGTWNHYVGGDTIMFANTSGPYMRVTSFSDGTLMYYNSRRANEQVKVLENGVWSDSLAAPWDDGVSELAQAGMTVWVAHSSFNTSGWYNEKYGPITVTGVKNNGQEILDPTTITSAVKVDTTNLMLTFNAVSGASSYNVYRGTSPDFVPDRQNGTNRVASAITDEDGGTAGIQWTDTGDVAGNAAVNYYYAVTALNGSESEPSEIYGEFDFYLITTPTTDFNEIALPLNVANISDASDLASAIPNCNSVAYWEPTIQGYYQYIPGLSSTNFDVYAGYPYYVNVVDNSVFTITGTLTDPTYSLVTTATTDFNEIMLPLDRSDITLASQLQADITSCNSVARWDASIQGYYQYIPGLSSTDFTTTIGYPYYVNVTSNVSWPSGSTVSARTALAKGTGNAASALTVPHMVYGSIPQSDQKIALVKAWMDDDASAFVTTTSPGSQLKDGVFALQIAALPNGWTIGKNLNIACLDSKGNTIFESNIVLTDQAADKVLNLTNTVSELPSSYTLTQNYPNPFNPETLIRYALPQDDYVKLNVYNTMGQQIRTLVDGQKSAGSYQVVWNGKNDSGLNVPSGMYFYVMESSNFKKQMKAILIR